MLTVSTKLDSSPIEGVGLFSTEFIAKGTVIWLYDKRTTVSYSKEEWNLLLQELPQTALKGFERFAYFNKGMWLLNLDDSRFMNHSDNPNIGYDNVSDQCYALVDILPGQELTCRYEDFCEEA